MSKLKRLLAGTALLLGAAALMRYPVESAQAAREGLLLCRDTIIPSLFPFFVLSGLVVDLGYPRLLGRVMRPMMGPLFRLPGAGASALALGCIGGYPVGAKTAAQLYTSGQCSKEEAERLLGFCNNCGPAFLLGVVGAGVFSSAAAGVLLLAVHLAAALCVGLVFRWVGKGKHPSRNASSAAGGQTAGSLAIAFTEAVKSAFFSTLTICAFVIFFRVVIRLLAASGLLVGAAAALAALLSPLGMTLPWAESLLAGLLEVSTGVTSLSSGSTGAKLVTAAFLLGWGGLSVHFQTLSVISPAGLSPRFYFRGKALHGLFSALFMLPLTRLLPKETVTIFAPAGSALPGALTPYLLAAGRAALVLAGAAALLWLLLALCSKRPRRK